MFPISQFTGHWGAFLSVLRENVPISAYSQGRGAERGLKNYLI